jgi:hypothetical protein
MTFGKWSALESKADKSLGEEEEMAKQGKG